MRINESGNIEPTQKKPSEVKGESASGSQGKRPYDDIIAGVYKGNEIKKFGITHYRYEDCPSSRLKSIGNNIVVRDDCAEAFEAMQAAAKKDGVNLTPVSGYRSSKYQVTVFKKKFKDSNGKEVYPTDSQMKSRLKYSAPSGFSEHHTGLAIDINDTEERFKDTKAYAWLKENAHEYGFELSFPEDNAQGLGFEPWHWRYVGKNGENEEIFQAARMHDPRFSNYLAQN